MTYLGMVVGCCLFQTNDVLGGYLIGCICSFICLSVFVCVHDNSKSNEQSFLKSFTWLGPNQTLKFLNFGKDLDRIYP